MKYEALASQITTPVFQTYQVARLFPQEPAVALRFQLSRLTKRQKLIRLKRGLYLFPERQIDELALSNLIYSPSYVSLEWALHHYGLIPDIPAAVTAITTITPNIFTTPRGTFVYSCVNRPLYFGFAQKVDPRSQLPYSIAEPEKALLDWIYVRKIKDLEANRVNIAQLDLDRLAEFSTEFPGWVRSAVK